MTLGQFLAKGVEDGLSLIWRHEGRQCSTGSGTSPAASWWRSTNVVSALPFIVRRDHRIVTAFARKAAVDWAELLSFNDESRFTVHTAQEIINVFQNGETLR